MIQKCISHYNKETMLKTTKGQKKHVFHTKNPFSFVTWPQSTRRPNCIPPHKPDTDYPPVQAAIFARPNFSRLTEITILPRGFGSIFVQLMTEKLRDEKFKRWNTKIFCSENEAFVFRTTQMFLFFFTKYHGRKTGRICDIFFLLLVITIKTFEKTTIKDDNSIIKGTSKTRNSYKIFGWIGPQHTPRTESTHQRTQGHNAVCV